MRAQMLERRINKEKKRKAEEAERMQEKLRNISIEGPQTLDPELKQKIESMGSMGLMPSTYSMLSRVATSSVSVIAWIKYFSARNFIMLPAGSGFSKRLVMTCNSCLVLALGLGLLL